LHQFFAFTLNLSMAAEEGCNTEAMGKSFLLAISCPATTSNNLLPILRCVVLLEPHLLHCQQRGPLLVLRLPRFPSTLVPITGVLGHALLSQKQCSRCTLDNTASCLSHAGIRGETSAHTSFPVAPATKGCFSLFSVPDELQRPSSDLLELLLGLCCDGLSPYEKNTQKKIRQPDHFATILHSVPPPLL
jgi:hypothetical protein